MNAALTKDLIARLIPHAREWIGGSLMEALADEFGLTISSGLFRLQALSWERDGQVYYCGMSFKGTELAVVAHPNRLTIDLAQPGSVETLQGILDDPGWAYPADRALAKEISEKATYTGGLGYRISQT